MLFNSNLMCRSLIWILYTLQFFFPDVCCSIQGKWEKSSHKSVSWVLDQQWNANTENCLLHCHTFFSFSFHLYTKVWPSFWLLSNIPLLFFLPGAWEYFSIDFQMVKFFEGKLFSFCSIYCIEENGIHCHYLVCTSNFTVLHKW